LTLASIGPITTATLEKLGFAAQITARDYTIEGLLDAMKQHFAETTPCPSP
jgi:uroporphyrinogen III methyltransferase/synthase